MTIKINRNIQPAWLMWMQDIFVDDLMRTGCFLTYQLVRLLEIDDDEGPTYALQLYMQSRVDYQRYREEYSSYNDKMSYEKWGNDVLSFSTLMEVISGKQNGKEGQLKV